MGSLLDLVIEHQLFSVGNRTVIQSLYTVVQLFQSFVVRQIPQVVEIGFRRVGNLKVVCNIHPGDSCIVQRDMQRVGQFFKCKSGVSPRKVDHVVPVKELAKTAVANRYPLCCCSDSQIVNMGGVCSSKSSGNRFGIQITSNRLDKVQLLGIN